MSKVKKGAKTVKKAQSKPSSKISKTKLYWKIYRAGADEALKNGFELTGFEKRALAAELRGRLGNLPQSKLTNNVIRSEAMLLLFDEEVFNVPPSQPSGRVPKESGESNYFNPLLLQTQDIAGIPWFEIDDFMRHQLSGLTMGKDLRIIVDAGPALGRIEFSLSNFDYESTGLRGVVETIRKEYENKSDPDWNGVAVVRFGFKDDGNPDSYALKMVLFSGTGPIGDIHEATAPKELTDEQARERALALEVGKQERQKTAKEEQQQRSRDRERPRKKEAPEPQKPKGKKPVKKEVVESENQKMAKLRIKLVSQFNKAKQLARKDFDDKILTAKEYKSKISKLEKQMATELRKMKKGGLV